MSFWGKWLLSNCDADLSININAHNLLPGEKREACITALFLGILLRG